MNEAANKAKQTIVDKIKTSTNILVTVSTNPTVDDLSAALGLTALLNKLGKHATAIFSGSIPPAITFLEPDKVFENNANSLRDFIIALDKEKADHLRYKVEGDLVKIFITPYRTHIGSEDLEFSQGDYNVELVLALGVNDQTHLDIALSAQNEMMSDVTIATFSAGTDSSNLGSIDWRDEGASCLSEMIAVMSTDFQTDKSLLDQQISTALLTGIVSATDRFSNSLTSSRVMATAAQLMATGADQQLIASKLQESHVIDSLPARAVDKLPEPVGQPSDNTNSLVISHDSDIESKTIEEIEASLPTKSKTPKVGPEPVSEPEIELVEVSETSTLLQPSNEEVRSDDFSVKTEMQDEPLLGGILNSTSDQAAEDARRQLEDQQNKTILSHSYLGQNSSDVAPINSAVSESETTDIDIFSKPPGPSADDDDSTPIEPNTQKPIISTVTDLPLPPPPPVTDFSTLPPTSTLQDVNLPLPPAQEELPPVSTLPDPNDPSQFKIPQS